jgi:myo-inositol-1(or 4)-monophosphatase
MPHIPSLAYRIAIIADGRLDATFIKPNSHDWDLAAADLVLTEAGGIVHRKDGIKPVYAGETTVHDILVAGNARLIPAMLGVVADTAIG